MSGSLRYRVDPGDVSTAKAARRMGLTAADFMVALPKLIERGFPAPDPTTGMFCLEAIDAWRRARYPDLLLTPGETARDARAVVPDRLRGTDGGEGEDTLLRRP